MRPASPLLTSMPGMRVLDAHVHIGCRHLLALKVHHQLTLVGIEGATLVADPENLDLPCSYPGASEVADCWRHPRYLTRRGNFHHQKCPYPWLAPIPATPIYQGCVSRSHQFSPCDALSPKDDISLSADGNECLTQGLRKRICLSSHTGRVTGAHPRVLTRLLSLPTPSHKTSRNASKREMSELQFAVVVVWYRLVVWQSGVQCDVSDFDKSYPGHVEALHWREMSQLLQQSEVTQRR
jgi:hypothetical protein